MCTFQQQKFETLLKSGLWKKSDFIISHFAAALGEAPEFSESFSFYK